MTVAKYDTFIAWLEQNWDKCDGLGDTKYDEWREAVTRIIKRLKGMLSFMNSGDWSRQRMPEFIEYINKMDGIRNTNFRDVIYIPEMVPLFRLDTAKQEMTGMESSMTGY